MKNATTARSTSAAPTTKSLNLKPGELPAASLIPAVPEGYKALDLPTKQPLLKVAAEQRAEIDQAMVHLWENRVQLAQDLGTLAPRADDTQALNERMLAAREANRKAQALAAYTEDQELLANHAVVSHVNSVSGDIEHMAQKNPQIADRHDTVLTVAFQRRGAIVAGIARAKATKAADDKNKI